MDAFDLRLWPRFKEIVTDLSTPYITDQITIDSRRIDSNHALFVALPGTSHDGHQFIKQAEESGARYALVRKEWNRSFTSDKLLLLRVDNPLEAFQDIAHSYRNQLGAEIIGITGSYGKTMVKDLLFAMVNTTKQTIASPESFNSQIGVPLSLLTIRKNHEVAFIEAGISKKYEMDILANIIAPTSTILTHVGKKHLTTLENIHTTAEEMSKLLAKANNWVFYPNVPVLHPFSSTIKAPIHFWNEKNPELPFATKLESKQSDKMSYCINFPDGNSYAGETSFGFYYFLDLLNITTQAAWKLGVSSESISETLLNYTPEPMRTEIWRSPFGTTFINEPYCSDPQSVDLALKHLDHGPINSRKIFVFGGMRGKSQHHETDYRRIGQAINQSKVQWLMLVGNHPFTSLITEIKSKSPETEITQCKTYEEAIHQIRLNVQPDDLILVKGEKKESLNHLTETFNDSISNNQCFINLAAIQRNIATIRKKLPKETRIMVVVKALAYGTDDIRIANFLSSCGVDILGVSYVDEGIALKRAGITQDIFVINAAIYETIKIVKWDLEVGVSDKNFISKLQEQAFLHKKQIKVHLHIDTGMSRFGCRPEEALALCQLILASPNLILEGVMTHFACADNADDDAFTLSQSHCFEKVILELESHHIHPKWRHAANSSAAIRFNFPNFNMVRLGLAVYGLNASETTKNAMDLKLALSLTSRIVGINVCKAGETISYGRNYTVNRDQQKIAVLPIGYFDGLHRNYSGKSHVIIRGQKAPMVGNICMDFMMVDVTDIEDVSVGDSVLIFGEDEHGHYLAPEDLAAKGASIVHELITCLGPRIQRVFIHEEN